MRNGNLERGKRKEKVELEEEGGEGVSAGGGRRRGSWRNGIDSGGALSK